MSIFASGKFPVRLDEQQRQRLEEVTRTGHAPVAKVRHARVLLLADQNRPGGGWTDARIGEALGLHVNSVAKVRKRFVTEGEEPALNRKPRTEPPVPPKIDGRVEAHLVAICCGPAPAGHARWTLTLLAHELRQRGLVTSVSIETVRKALKKTNCNPGASRPGASPSVMRPASSPRWRRSSTCTSPATAPRSP